MIQRIQTIFLFVVVLALIAFNFFPYWQSVPQNEEAINLLFSYALVITDGDEAVLTYGLYTLVAGLTGIAALLAIIEITMFKNRVLQMKLGALNSIVMTSALGLMTYFVLQLQKSLSGSFGISIFILAAAMIANVMARRFIHKDEKLVRSVDRIR